MSRCGVYSALAEALSGINRYPDPSYSQLRQALADRYGVPWERIALGAGSCDLILAAGEALLEPAVYARQAVVELEGAIEDLQAILLQLGEDTEEAVA